jgi:hypothetical protein
MLRALQEEETAGFPGFRALLKRQINYRLGLDPREGGEAVLRHWGLSEVLALCQRRSVEVAAFVRRAIEAFFLSGVNLADIHQVA